MKTDEERIAEGFLKVVEDIDAAAADRRTTEEREHAAAVAFGEAMVKGAEWSEGSIDGGDEAA